MRSLLLVAAALAATPALAHPKLTSATPADAAQVKAPTTVSLSFSEAFLPQMTQVQVSMISMPGMGSHAPMPMKVERIDYAADNKAMTAVFKSPLPAGGYRVEYRTVGADTHRIEGSYTFTVR